MTDPLGLINQSAAAPGTGPLRPMFPGSLAQAKGHEAPSFKDVLMKNIEQVNRLQQDAEMAIEDLAAGRRGDVDAVLLAKQKADLAFQLLLQVRNKLVNAYDEIKQMRV